MNEQRHKIVLVAGARPNFVKIAPLLGRMDPDPELQAVLVHTGQHYDEKMSGGFFRDLEIRAPDYNLEVGSGSHAVQTARILESFEQVLNKERPELVVVVGDVNSTLACTLTAAKMGIATAHVEAGLRSFDRTMPEEINRVLTDAIADILYTSEADANRNLKREGIPPERICFVGNVMIDSLLKYRSKADRSRVLESLGIEAGGYVLATLHRPSNVDSADVLGGILEALDRIAQRLPVVFPLHPRTRSQIEAFGLGARLHDARSPTRTGILACEPLGYLDFLKLAAEARLVVTDSGGLQEETTILGVPCVTVRENTERPATVRQGTNVLAGVSCDSIVSAAFAALERRGKSFQRPELWDGNAAGRIVTHMKGRLGRRADADGPRPR